MPDRLAYDEAMLFSSARLKLPDPELKRGKVATITARTTAGLIERPWGIEGGFAVVYKFRTSGGKFRALRCFRVAMSADIQFRYERLASYFRFHAADITVDFKYHPAAILVKEQGKQQAYPVIDMAWIDGQTLLEAVDELCQKRDRHGLQYLTRQWLALLERMRQSHIAHGDLAAANVMIQSDGKLVLVDYDGVYIPEFAGMNMILLGQPGYQHPQIAQRPFDEYMDDFSALVIYTALVALETQPELWEQYVKHDRHGRMLDTTFLFTQQDFVEPAQSALFRELGRSNDTRVVEAVNELQRACRLPVQQVRFPSYLLDSNYAIYGAPVSLNQASRQDRNKGVLLEALKRKETRLALHLACNLQTMVGDEIEEPLRKQLQEALLSHVRQHVLTGLHVRIEERTGGYCAVVAWSWPEDTWIQNVLITWKPECWPPVLPERHQFSFAKGQIWVKRNGQQREGHCEFFISDCTHIYVQAYTALLDIWDTQQRWCFSAASAPTSRCEAIYLPE